MGKIWEKYLLKTFFKSFFLVLFGFYGLYVLIDYSSHTTHFYGESGSVMLQFIKKYLYELSNRLDLLLPFALLIATIKTLTQLNSHNELVALLASGVSIRRILRPLLFVGLFFTALLYLNTEWVIPDAKNHLKKFTEARQVHKKEQAKQISIQHLVLSDESKVLFQNYDSIHKRFFDVFWVESSEELYHMEYLYPYEAVPRGEKVQLFQKDPDGRYVRRSYENTKIFSTMHFNQKRLQETTTLPEELSYSLLWKRLPKKGKAENEKQSAHLTVFYQKLALPWLCLLAIIGPAPFCVRFSRTLPIFFLYAVFTFGLIALHILLKASGVLGKRQVLDPFIVIFIPFALFTFPALWCYHRQY